MTLHFANKVFMVLLCKKLFVIICLMFMLEDLSKIVSVINLILLGRTKYEKI